MGIMETGLHAAGAMCQMLFHEESMARLRNVYADHRARVFSCADCGIGCLRVSVRKWG